MRPFHRHPLAVLAMTAVLLLGAAACSSSDSDDSASSDGGGEKTTTTAAEAGAATPQLDKLEGKTIGVQTGTTGETFANENKPEGATVKSYADTDGLFGALQSGEIDAVLQDLVVNAGRAQQDDSVEVVETYKTDEEYGFAVEKGNTELLDELNGALSDLKDDGTYDAIYAKYFPEAGQEPGPGPDPSDVQGSKTITVCSDIPYAPMEYEGEGPRGLQYTGFDIDLMDAMAASVDAKLSVIDVDFDGILGNLASGKCDVVASSLTITDERKKEVDFTDAYFDANQSLLVKAS